MDKLKALFNSQSIRTRLISWFLLISLIPLLWTTLIAYELTRDILFDQAIRHLKAFILRQEQLINFYLEEKKSNAKIFKQTTLNALSQLNEILSREGKDSPTYQDAKKKVDSLLANHMSALDYENLILVTDSGKIVYSFQPFPFIGDNLYDLKSLENLKHVFERSRDSLEMHMTSSIFKPDRNALNSFIAVPLIDFQNKLAGITIVKLNTSAMYQFLSGFNELETLADLLLVADINHALYAIQPTATQNNQEASQIIDPQTPFGQYIQKLLTDHRLLTTQVTYDNQMSLIVGRRFERAFNWALVTRINESRLLRPIYRLQSLFWILVSTTAFVVILAASNVARKIASPILTLTEKTKILAAGDLSQRIEVKSEDEIGKLGESFNNMAAQLDHIISHLDDLVAKRTEAYEIQNVTLQQTIEELRETRDRLIIQEKLASLGALTAGIAHEIKNPLNFINNFAELSLQLRENLEGHLNAIKSFISEKEAQELKDSLNTLKLNLSKIYEHGKRADSIVHNMLQHSRGTPGEKILTDIHKLLDEYIALSYHGMRAQDATFKVKIEKLYDSSISSINVVPQEISRVFLNLLNNAYYSVNQKAKQQPADSTYEPIVRIKTEKYQNQIMIKIWDNGLGFSSHILSKLFTPFFTTKPTGAGTGLGLSLSYNIIVQGHGGSLSAESREGEYAEFTITLPNK